MTSITSMTSMTTLPTTIATAAPTRARIDPLGLACFLFVCAIGGSTFLAIRVAVGPASGFPPMWMSATRFTIAAVLLLAGLIAARRPIGMSPRRLVAVLASGALLWGGGNGLATLASRQTGAGLVALFFAAGPIWVAVLDAILSRRRPTSTTFVAMLLGLVGVTVLMLPSLARSNTPYTALGTGVLASLVLAPFSYALGVVALKRAGGSSGVLVTAAWQMLGGAVALWVAVIVSAEPVPHPSWTAIGAWAYLTIVGSIAGFSAFTVALRRLPMPLFMSHAWVNPVIAVLLGAWMLGERIPSTAFIGAGLVLAALVSLTIAAANARKPVGA